MIFAAAKGAYSPIALQLAEALTILNGPQISRQFETVTYVSTVDRALSQPIVLG